MTQKHVQISAHIVLLILGVTTAWADVEKQGRRELLPLPTCCCEKAESSTPACCAKTESCPACSKEKSAAVDCRLRAICSVDFKDTPLQQAVERFREWSGVNIVVDEPALEEAGISFLRPMSLKVDGVPLKRALEMLLHQVHLSYVVENDVVVLTSEAHARGELINRVYRVEGLVPHSEPMVIALGDREPMFGWATESPTGTQVLDEAPEDTLVRLLMQTIQPQSWNGNGGLGTVDYFPPSKSLVVYQTKDVQEQVGDLLAALNRTLERDAAVKAPDPLLGLPVSAPSACPLLTASTPLPDAWAQPVAPPPPVPHNSLAFSCPPVGLASRAPSPVPPMPTARKAYVLRVEMVANRQDGKVSGAKDDLVTRKMEMAFIPEPTFHGSVMTEETGADNRKWLLQVKATPSKDDRMHLEIVSVQGKARQTSSGNVAMELVAAPIVDRKLQLGKPTKVVLERENGKPCKWMRVTVTEMPPAPPTPEVCYAVPQPTPAAQPCQSCPLACIPTCAYVPMSSVAAPMPCLTSLMPCQPQNQLQPTCQVGAVAEDRKALEIKISGSDPLKLTAVGSQIQATNSCLQARADAISRSGPAGCFVFEGHVQIRYTKEDQRVEMTAERVLVNVADGHMEIEAAPSPQFQPFSFWGGFSR
jgi:hypothetical protein